MKDASGAMVLMIQSTAEPSKSTKTKGTKRPSPWLLNAPAVRSAVRGMTTSPVYHLRLFDIFPDHRGVEEQRVHVRSREHHHRLDRRRHHRIPARVERGVEERADP